MRFGQLATGNARAVANLHRSHRVRLTRQRLVAAGMAVLFALAILCRPTPALAASPVVKVSPQQAEISTGQEADVLITVDDAAALYGIDIRLAFDPALLEALDLDEGKDGVQVGGGEYPYPDFVVKNVVDNAAGTIWYAVTQLNTSHPEPANGSGTVITIRFRGKSQGTTTIDLTHVEPVDRHGEDLVWDATGGEVVVSAAQAPTATATAAAPTDTPQPTPEGPTNTPPPPTDTPQPTATPEATATSEPTASEEPTGEPTAEATETPTIGPTAEPTAQPTAQPTATATEMLPAEPTPTADLTAQAIATAAAQALSRTRAQTPSTTPTATAEPTSPPTASATLTQPQPTETAVRVAAVVATVEPTATVPPKQETPRPPILEGVVVFAALVLVGFLLKRGIGSAR